MPRLSNPLDKFASYSTHFIILVARTTENAKKFADSDSTTNPENAQKTLDAINATPSLGAAVPYDNTSDVYLAVDTRRFSQFTIKSMKFETLINGLSEGQSHSNVSNLIEMTLLDSVGITFINYLQWLMDAQLKTNFDGMIFLIRVVFVGHNPDGTSETVQSVTIPAHLNRMEVNLDYSKGVYTLEFMPNFNFSVVKHQRWLSIGTASTFFSQVGKNTLGDMVQGFQDRLNQYSTKLYNELDAVVRNAYGTPQDVKGKFGRKVQYMITLPASWEKLEFFGASADGKVERNFIEELKKAEAKTATPAAGTKQTSSSSSPSTSSHMAVQSNIGITQVLDLMFKQVPALRQFGSDDQVGTSDKVITFYKHVLSVSSDDTTVVIHVDVVPFEVPNVKPPSQSAGSQVSQNQSKFFNEVVDDVTGLTKRIPKDFFELDYIFTGKNHDILNFDMKIQDLQFLLTSNTRVSEGVFIGRQLQGQSQQELDAKQKEEQAALRELLNAREYDPILIPMMTKVEQAAFSQYVSQRSENAMKFQAKKDKEYARNLSAFYAISPIMISMTIRGNPDIMTKFNVPTFSPHPAPAETSQSYRQRFEQSILRRGFTQNENGNFSLDVPLGSASYLTRPVFTKVNIRGPNTTITGELIQNENFSTEVLYDNYYVVFKVTNTIEDGVFTQDLEMWSHNVFGAAKLGKTDVESSRVTQQR